MKYIVTHITRYRYSAPVSVGYNEVRLKPRTTRTQTCNDFSLEILPRQFVLDERTDYFGNGVHYFSIQLPHTELTVTARSEVEVSPPSSLLDFSGARKWELVREQLREHTDSEIIAAREFTLESPLVSYTPALADYAEPSFSRGRPILEAVHNLMERIFEDFKYDPTFTTVATPLKTVLEFKRGVCQDFAHLAIGCLRAKGLAATYISGYLETLPPKGKPRLIGADASHAWFSVYVPDCGWVAFDPTNNQQPNERYIVTAWGRDYSDVTPLKGVIYGGGSGHQLSVSVDVMPIT